MAPSLMNMVNGVTCVFIQWPTVVCKNMSKKFEYNLCIGHQPGIIPIYTITVATNARKYNEISLYTQRTPACFSQPCGKLITILK